MRPKKPEKTGEGDLFRARLEQIIDLKHELVQLAGKIDWGWIDREIAPRAAPGSRPAATRWPMGAGRTWARMAAKTLLVRASRDDLHDDGERREDGAESRSRTGSRPWVL
jgi:hypothetical protein